MTAWFIEEHEDVYSYFERNLLEIHVDDTIEIIPNNQEGYKKYKVVLNEKDEKSLHVIADWFIGLYEE